MDSSGNISGGRIDKENNAYWKIDKSGSAIFNNLTANGTGYIGPWTISANELTNGNVGLGNHTFTKSSLDSAFGVTFNGNRQGVFWGKNGTDDSNVNFLVDNEGNMYSKSGLIGGWFVDKDSLSSGGLKIKSTSTGG